MTRLSEIHGPSQPAGRLPSNASIAAGRLLDQRPLRRLVEHALPLGIGPSVPHDLVAPRAERVHHLRAVAVDAAVDENRNRKIEPVEQVDQAPHPDAIAVFAPGVIEHVRVMGVRGKLRPMALAEGEVLEIEADIDRKPRPVRPFVGRPLLDAAVGKALVVRQQSARDGRRLLRFRHAASPRGGRAAGTASRPSSARPARASRISALSFQTSMRTILPRLTTNRST